MIIISTKFCCTTENGCNSNGWTFSWLMMPNIYLFSHVSCLGEEFAQLWLGGFWKILEIRLQFFSLDLVFTLHKNNVSTNTLLHTFCRENTASVVKLHRLKVCQNPVLWTTSEILAVFPTSPPPPKKTNPIWCHNPWKLLTPEYPVTVVSN